MINKQESINTNAPQMAYTGPNGKAYVVNLLIELLLLCIEIITIASQLVDTHLYLFNIVHRLFIIFVSSNIAVAYLKNYHVLYLPVCQTYCTQT